MANPSCCRFPMNVLLQHKEELVDTRNIGDRAALYCKQCDVLVSDHVFVADAPAPKNAPTADAICAAPEKGAAPDPQKRALVEEVKSFLLLVNSLIWFFLLPTPESMKLPILLFALLVGIAAVSSFGHCVYHLGCILG
eukprot:GDKI01006946.1.p1 GENE.GDKI01006946.1~~GDKI01006946.1.p1  ORF type:complete len:138 (+),score=13.55 GDKI01006946.1:76-489(+)